MKTIFTKLYLLAIIAVTICLMVLIWNLTFGHIVEEYKERKEFEQASTGADQKENAIKKENFKDLILDSEERVKHYLGYKILDVKRIEGHFHHIDYEQVPDKRSYCISCHGDIPHDKIKEIRAFANMHASFIACQTCHVKLEKDDITNVYKWYDRTSGEIVASPVKEGVLPGIYQAKIIPFEKKDGLLQRMDNQERMDFAAEFKLNEPMLSELQKTKAKKIIHNLISKQPYSCEDCHQTKAPLLPFEDLGYTRKRVNAFLGTEVIGMIKNYSEFYMPRMLNPGFGEEKKEK
ncbi:MAG: cytochrome c3 family protein [Desulfobacula sp.]|jgi:hypothetical protein|nr:cytochrome c3 family protein [Desulfobacula sp.]